MVPCDLFLKRVDQVALCHREDFPGWLVFGVSLQLNLRQPDFLLEVSDSGPFRLFFSPAILMLHWSTLPEAASSQAGHSAS